MTKAIDASRGLECASAGCDLNRSDRVTPPALFFPSEKLSAIRAAVTGARPMLQDDHSRRSKILATKNIWNDSVSAEGTVAEDHLTSLGVTIRGRPLPGIRFNPKVLYEPTRRMAPAIIAPVHDLDGAFVGIHKTYLFNDQVQIWESKGGGCRMLGRCHGSFIQLSNLVGPRLVLSESIEMAIGIMQSCPGLPVWSAMTLGNMKSVIPNTVRELILCADGNNREPVIAHKILMDAVRDHMSRGLTVLVAQPLSGKRLPSNPWRR